jgi:capsid protein
VRGLSGLYHALNNARDKRDILGFEKTAVKLISALGMVITSDSNGGAKGFFGPQSTEQTGQDSTVTLEKVFGGTIPKLKPGEALNPIASGRPSPTFAGFLETLDRDVATGLGLPLEFVWDSAALGGTGQRFVLEKAQGRFEERQDDSLIPFTNWVRRWVIADGISKRVIPDHPLWYRYYYQRRSKITVDVGREAVANREDVRGGLRTIQEDYGERGRNWIDARNDNQKAARDLLIRARELVSEFKAEGLTLDAAVKMMEDRSPAQIMFGPQDIVTNETSTRNQ